MGARRELTEALNGLNQTKIREDLLQHCCDWFNFKVNVGLTSHTSGDWERQIRSVRNVLAVLLSHNASQLDDESLSTSMCEAEATVNSRPLSVESLQDPDARSPSRQTI